jgi:acyl-CoA thioesterase
MSFIKPLHPGDTVTAEAREVHNGRSTGVYLITLTNQREEQVGLFKGTCFRTGKPLIGAPASL